MTKPLTGKEPAYPTIKSSQGGEYADSPVSDVWSEGGMPIRLHLAATLGSGAMSMADIESFGVKEAARVALKFADELIRQYNKEQE